MSYRREISDKYPAVSAKLEAFSQDDLIGWLAKQANTHKLTYLLAHATDGVIWGRVDENGTLYTSHQAVKADKPDNIDWNNWDNYRIKTSKNSLPPLRGETLQQARLFSEAAELYIWRDGDGEWNGRWLRDAAEGETPDWSESFDEPQLLWGTHGTRLEHGFTLLEDGAQGLYHAVPLALQLNEQTNGELKQSVQLNIRHYLAYDEQGQAFVAVSRLVEVKEE
jgi:CRISPR-associated protein (TIGR03984 family)